MKIFAAYTGARLALFLVVFGLIWLVFGRSIEWNAATGLYTALISLVISSVIALIALRGLRARLSEHVSARAEAARLAFAQRRAAEDEDDGPDDPAGGDRSA